MAEQTVLRGVDGWVASADTAVRPRLARRNTAGEWGGLAPRWGQRQVERRPRAGRVVAVGLRHPAEPGLAADDQDRRVVQADEIARQVAHPDPAAILVVGEVSAGEFYSPAVLVKNAQRDGMRVPPIDVKESDRRCTVREFARRVRLQKNELGVLAETGMLNSLGPTSTAQVLNPPRGRHYYVETVSP